MISLPLEAAGKSVSFMLFKLCQRVTAKYLKCDGWFALVVPASHVPGNVASVSRSSGNTIVVQSVQWLIDDGCQDR